MNKGTKMKNWNPVVIITTRAGSSGVNTFRMECLLEEVFEDNPWLEADRLYLEHKLSNSEVYYISDSLWIRLK